MSYYPERFFSQSGIENFSQVLLQAYQDAPEQVILRLLFSGKPDLPITYRQLMQRALRYTEALEEANIGSDEVVILILQHGEDLVSAFFGAILHGAIPSIMPFLTEKLHPDQYRLSLEALFAITTPAAVITYADFVDEARIASAGSSVRAVLLAEEILHAEMSATVLDDRAFNHIGGLSRSPSSIVLLQHSSGTTGLQKGVALTHQSVFNQLESYSQALRLDPEDVIVSWLPLYHDMGLIAGFILPILLRIPLVLISPFDWVRAPQRLLQAIHRFRGTLCWLPNFAFNFCAQKIRDRELENIDLSSLRAVTNCSEPLHWKSHAKFLERFSPNGLRVEALATSYAMAENVFAVTQGGIQEVVTVDAIDQQCFMNAQIAQRVDAGTGPSSGGTKPVIKMLSAGRPIAGTRIRILDPNGQDLPERHIGEIALQSNCLLAGYYHRPDLTDKSFLDGWFLTGDLGYLAEAELYVTGRKKDLIIVGGKNIYPQDLENLAGEVEGVHPGRVVAFGEFNEDTGTEDVVLIAEVDEASPGTFWDKTLERNDELERIAQEIRQRVTHGSDVALRYVHLVGSNWLIKTSSGKVARGANKTKYLSEAH